VRQTSLWNFQPPSQGGTEKRNSKALRLGVSVADFLSLCMQQVNYFFTPGKTDRYRKTEQEDTEDTKDPKLSETNLFSLLWFPIQVFFPGDYIYGWMT
jgi:hypothetical protein